MTPAKNTYRHLLLISFLLCLGYVTTTQAKDSIYMREYTYDASELDSRASARNNALKLMKSELLEEISSFIISEQDLRRTVHNEEAITQAESQVRSISVGQVRSQVIDETWDGKKFWIRAKLYVDKDAVAKTLQQYLRSAKAGSADPSGINPAPFQATDPAYGGYLMLARTSSVLALLAPIRMRAMQYYSMEGKWPADLTSLGFKPGSMTDGETIANVIVGKDGELKALLTKQFGEDKYLSLKPRDVMGGSSTHWDCHTNLSAEIFKIPGAYRCEVD